jgi:hypothetical protein
MPTYDLLGVGDSVTFVSIRVNTEKRSIRVRSGVVIPRGFENCVAEGGRTWAVGRIHLRTVRRSGVLIACAPCVPVGPESSLLPPVQPAAPPKAPPKERPRTLRERVGPEDLAHLDRLAAVEAARKQVEVDKVHAEVAAAERLVAQRRAAFAEQSARLDAAREASERVFLEQRAAYRATLSPADRARLERHDRTLEAARERAARPRPRRTMPPETA